VGREIAQLDGAAEGALRLAGLLHGQHAFNAHGLVARSVLDYSPGFVFRAPERLTVQSVEQFLAAAPAYAVWKRHEGFAWLLTHWSSQHGGVWHWPQYAGPAPTAVLRDRWLVVALTAQPMPERGMAG
jgi:hypothetical protein